jgi:hypothetical protein
MPPEMISKRNHFRLLPPHWWVVKPDLQKTLAAATNFLAFRFIYTARCRSKAFRRYFDLGFGDKSNDVSIWGRKSRYRI